jgi:hypothetical protein
MKVSALLESMPASAGSGPPDHGRGRHLRDPRVRWLGNNQIAALLERFEQA